MPKNKIKVATLMQATEQASKQATEQATEQASEQASEQATEQATEQKATQKATQAQIDRDNAVNDDNDINNYIVEGAIQDGLSSTDNHRIATIIAKSDAKNGKNNVLIAHYSLLNAIENIWRCRSIANVNPFARLLNVAGVNALGSAAKKFAKKRALDYISAYTFGEKGLKPLQKKIREFNGVKYAVFTPYEPYKYDYTKDLTNNMAKYLVSANNVNVQISSNEYHEYNVYSFGSNAKHRRDYSLEPNLIYNPDTDCIYQKA